MWRSYYNLQALYETPTLPSGTETSEFVRDKIAAIIAAARTEGRTVLTETESKQIMAAYGIPTVETHIATSEDEADRAAVARLPGRPQALLQNDHA